MTTELPYSTDHRFSKVTSELFRDLGDYDFVNPISSQPWSTRSRVIAKQEIYQKYLKAEDVVQASWHQAQEKLRDPSWHSDMAGIVYINAILELRSNGKWLCEILALKESLPTVMDYAKADPALMRFIGVMDGPQRPCLSLVESPERPRNQPR